MGRRTILILVFVLALVVIAAVVVISLLGGGTPTDVTDQTPVPVSVEGDEQPGVIPVTPIQGTLVNVVVSNQTLRRGFQFPSTIEEFREETARLGYSLVITESRILETVGSNVITDTKDILGMYARNEIFQGETLTKDALVKDPTLIGFENYGPSSLIPSGSIAAAIPMDRLNSVAYALDEGDQIDIMITFHFYQIDEEFQTYLQNAGFFFVQESLQAAETAGAEGEEATAQITQDIVVIPQYGRFEQLPNGDLAHIGPSEDQRPIPISMILQNARVIQVGKWEPPALAQPPTPVPTPQAEGEVTPTPQVQVTPIPEPPDVLVVALSPQQQLLVKYAVESFADIDFALRGVDDGQLYTVDNIDLDFILNRFGIEVPPNFSHTVDIPGFEPTATPDPDAAPAGG